jgi:hypothetical protein
MTFHLFIQQVVVCVCVCINYYQPRKKKKDHFKLHHSHSWEEEEETPPDGLNNRRVGEGIPRAATLPVREAGF